MPDFGIGEGLAALFGGGDLLGTLFGGGAAAAEGAAGAGAAAGGLADIVGTGTGLAGGELGLAGTELAAGVPAAELASGAAFDTVGLGTLGTAADFLAAPAASGFNAAAITPGLDVFGGGPGTLGAATPPPQPTAFGGSTALSPNVANANASASVFDTGTGAVPGVGSTGAPSAVPAGGGATALSAPAGVSAPVDATAAGAPAAGAGATPGAASSSISDLLSKGGSGVLKSLESNPLGIALGAGGLGYNILQGEKQTKNQDALTADAHQATANSQQLTASGEALQQYLTNGTLPPNFQSQVDQAIKDAKTTAISNAAGQGQSTDPTQNTALAATLAKIDASRPNMQAQVASQLFSSGSSLVNAGQSAAGLSGELFRALVQNDTTQAANTGKAIATLAAALNGKSSNTIGGTNISVSQA